MFGTYTSRQAKSVGWSAQVLAPRWLVVVVFVVFVPREDIKHLPFAAVVQEFADLVTYTKCAVAVQGKKTEKRKENLTDWIFFDGQKNL